MSDSGNQRKIYICTRLTDYVVLGEPKENPQFSMEWLVNFKNNTIKQFGATDPAFSQKALDGKVVLENCIGLSPSIDMPNITSIYKGFINLPSKEIIFITDDVEPGQLGDKKLRYQESQQQFTKQPYLWEIKTIADSKSFLIITGETWQIQSNSLEPNKSYLKLGPFIIMQPAEMIRVYPNDGYAKIIYENRFIAINEKFIKIQRRLEQKSQGIGVQLKSESAYKYLGARKD